MSKMKKSIYFIYALKVLGMLLITNTHLVGVYPHDILASGGLIGNVIFLSVTGFLLVDLKEQNFFKWYFNKLKRIYPIVWIPTIILLLTGFYSLESRNLFNYLVFPTYYHFIGSIVVLYIPYYFVMKFDFLKNNILKVIGSISLIWIVIYIFVYDKSYYHIDTVREPFIWFLFGISMLLGAHFRLDFEKYYNNVKITNFIFTIISLGVYFVSKLLFSRYEQYSGFQIINQIILLLTLYYVFKSFMSIDGFLENKLGFLKKTFIFLASITLEVYMVQFVIIDKFAHIVFPLNLLIIIAVVIVSATVLYFVVHYLFKFLDKIFTKEKREQVQE